MDEYTGSAGGAGGLTPPQALEAERSILAAMMLDQSAVGRAVESMDAKAFYRSSHQKMFEALVALYTRNETADLITVTEELRRRGDLEAAGGAAAVASVLESATTIANLEHHIKIVHSKAILRMLIRATNEIQQQCYAAQEETASLLDQAEARIFGITDQRIGQGFTSIGDLVMPSMQHIDKLFQRKSQVTGVPSGWDDLDKLTSGWQSGDLIILAGRPSMGKCVSWRTLVVDPGTGARLTIEECVRRRMPTVLGIDDRGFVRRTPVGDWIDSGVKPVWRVTTRLGRTIEVTGHHPFLTVDGWRPLHDLAAGDRIGVPRTVPVTGTDTSWSLERVRLLAYLVAEGGLTEGEVCLTAAGAAHLADARACLAAEFPGHELVEQPDGRTWRIAAPAGAGAAFAAWLEGLEVLGRCAEVRRLPDVVWTWDHERLRQFLAVLFTRDGAFNPMLAESDIEVAVASDRLARDVQHALLRFGIVAAVRGEGAEAWRISIAEPDAVRRYETLVGWTNGVARHMPASGHGRSPRHGGRSISGHAPAPEWARARAALKHEAPAPVAAVAVRAATDIAASEDLAWDEIVEITSLGAMQVYDLTVPDGHNFIAGDVCVHNTSAVMNMAENAAIRFQIPVAVFSLEMSKEQLALRLLCSQSEVSLHKVRTGYLGNEDWPRLTTGAGMLTKAPIYIDDGPAQTVLEVRAKCRRLKAENKLGLVVIDYLQLMQPSGQVENRVQEISQISRGLKALAKELGVPIIALSQLSRAVEQRGGSGRPQLSDLRDSGSIEQDADIVMFVYREVVYKPDTPEPGKAQLIIAKQRNGPTDDVDLTFLRECTKFVPYSPAMSGEADSGFQ